MSRNTPLGGAAGLCFPRVSGDEPYRPTYMTYLATFSPRERG